MKLLNRYYIHILCGLFALSMSSCLEDKEELYDIVGPVATIPVFTALSTSPAPGSVDTLTVRYFSPNIAVKEIRINETVGTAEKKQVASKVVTDFNTENSYVDTFLYTVPANAANGPIILEAVAVTENDLTGTRTLTLNIP